MKNIITCNRLQLMKLVNALLATISTTEEVLDYSFEITNELYHVPTCDGGCVNEPSHVREITLTVKLL